MARRRRDHRDEELELDDPEPTRTAATAAGDGAPTKDPAEGPATGAHDEAPVLGPGDDERPGNGGDGSDGSEEGSLAGSPDDLDEFSRWWDPVLDFFAERRLFSGALVASVLLVGALVAVLALAGRDAPRSKPAARPTTTTTTTTVAPTTTTPGPRPAQAATDTPVEPVVEVEGRCAELVGEFRELFEKYPSGASVDDAGNERLNGLLGRIDTECRATDAQAFRTLELDVWLRYRPTEP
jgi:hypothetical protein